MSYVCDFILPYFWRMDVRAILDVVFDDENDSYYLYLFNKSPFYLSTYSDEFVSKLDIATSALTLPDVETEIKKKLQSFVGRTECLKLIIKINKTNKWETLLPYFAFLNTKSVTLSLIWSEEEPFELKRFEEILTSFASLAHGSVMLELKREVKGIKAPFILPVEAKHILKRFVETVRVKPEIWLISFGFCSFLVHNRRLQVHQAPLDRTDWFSTSFVLSSHTELFLFLIEELELSEYVFKFDVEVYELYSIQNFKFLNIRLNQPREVCLELDMALFNEICSNRSSLSVLIWTTTRECKLKLKFKITVFEGIEAKKCLPLLVKGVECLSLFFKVRAEFHWYPGFFGGKVSTWEIFRAIYSSKGKLTIPVYSIESSKRIGYLDKILYDSHYSFAFNR